MASKVNTLPRQYLFFGDNGLLNDHDHYSEFISLGAN